MKHRAVASGPQTQRKPHARVVSVEARRHDADEGARLAVEEKSRTEDPGVAAELRLPQAIVHHEHERRTRLSVVGRENAAKKRRNAKKVEAIGRDVARDVATSEAASAFSVGIQDIQLIVSNDILENVVLFANSKELRDGVMVARKVVACAGQIAHLKSDRVLEVSVREGIEDHIIDDAEHHGGGGDAEGKRDNRNYSEAAILGQAAQGVLKIAEKIFNMILDARLTAVLLDLFQSAEGQMGAPPRLFQAHARGHVVPDPLLQMETQLCVQPLFREAFVE